MLSTISISREGSRPHTTSSPAPPTSCCRRTGPAGRYLIDIIYISRQNIYTVRTCRDPAPAPAPDLLQDHDLTTGGGGGGADPADPEAEDIYISTKF